MSQWIVAQSVSGIWRDCLGQTFDGWQEAYRKLRELKRQHPSHALRVLLVDENGNELPFQSA
jgi:hypothetical protein